MTNSPETPSPDSTPTPDAGGAEGQRFDAASAVEPAERSAGADGAASIPAPEPPLAEPDATVALDRDEAPGPESAPGPGPDAAPGSESAPGPGPEAAPAPAPETPAREDREFDQGPLDDGTFTRLREPRSENRLALAEGVWHQVSPRYVWVQLISTGALLLIEVAIVLVLWLVLHQTWALIPGGILAVILLWTIVIIPRQARSIGYRLREDDLVFRRGILWQRIVAVPYGRMQLVDITHGPLDRGFGIAQLKFVTAAASTGVVIPGLPQTTAETLRDHLVDVAESRRTGL